MGTPLFRINGLGSVWVNAEVPEAAAAQVRRMAAEAGVGAPLAIREGVIADSVREEALASGADLVVVPQAGHGVMSLPCMRDVLFRFIDAASDADALAVEEAVKLLLAAGGAAGLALRGGAATLSSGATAIQFRKANLKLEVTPQITPEGSVILDVDVNKDSVGQITTAGFAIDTKHVQTQVLVENGGTVVIGGIFTQSENETENKVPLLGDIPVLGFFFKNNVRSSARSELLVFLTPKVVSERTSLR